MRVAVNETVLERGHIGTNIGTFEVQTLFKPEPCIFVEGRWVDIIKMLKLFEEDKTKLMLRMNTFKVESSTFIEGQL